MTKVLVHGNPETGAVWGLLVDALMAAGLDDEIVVASPPGFGAPLPEGWEPTRSAYVDWLAGRLEALSGPVDVLAHDWGAGHLYGLLEARPGLVRSWAADCAGLLNPDYVWHDNARVWQTPGEGEEAVAALVAIGPEVRFQAYLDLGADPAAARSMADACDDGMARCILGLYRDATQPAMAELGARLAAAGLPPGLVIDATADPYVSSELAGPMITALGAARLRLEGRGHWWMCEDPATAAAGLVGFWNGLDG